MPRADLYWFVVTTTQATGNVAVDQYDNVTRAPRQWAWWLGRPMSVMVDTMKARGIFVSVEPR
jgi:hypothetical protein